MSAVSFKQGLNLLAGSFVLGSHLNSFQSPSVGVCNFAVVERPPFSSARCDRQEQKMARDDRFYAFIVARTSRSRAHIRRICVHKRWLKAAAVVFLAVMAGLSYGFYGLTQQAEHLRIERENWKLRAENDKQKQELQRLNNRE